MAIKNQIDHRDAFRKQLAAGNINDMTAGRHGRTMKLAQRARRAALRRKAIKPRAGLQGPADGRTLAERLGMPVAKPSVKATPLKDMILPAPEVQLDPPVGEGELPPVAELTQADVPASEQPAVFNGPADVSASELPAMPKPWVEEPVDELLAPARVDGPGVFNVPGAEIDAEEAELQQMIRDEEAAEAAKEEEAAADDEEETDENPLL